jgi:hypothetical protein
VTLRHWVGFAGFVFIVFGIAHIMARSADWYGDWGSPSFELEGWKAVVQGIVEVVIGTILFAGSALDYSGIIDFAPVMRIVKAALEF